MVKMVKSIVEFTTKEGKRVRFEKMVRAPPKTSAELKRRLKNLPMALKIEAEKKWHAKHTKAGVENKMHKKHSKITGRYYSKKS